jgi:multiple sugar transport system ATP-binding protein
VPARAVTERPGLDRFLGREVIIGVRPSAFEDAAFAPEGRPRIKAEVTVTEELGSEANLLFTVHAPQVHHDVMVAKFDRAAKDEVEAEELAAAGESLWTARVNPETSARPGRTVDLAVDPNQIHFFDPQTGRTIARQQARVRT